MVIKPEISRKDKSDKKKKKGSLKRPLDSKYRMEEGKNYKPC